MSRPVRVTQPEEGLPAAADFAAHPPAGPHGARLAVGPLAVALEGLDEACLASLQRWARPTTAAGRHDLRIQWLRAERPGFLEAEPGQRARLRTWRAGGAPSMVTHHAALLMDGGAREGLALLARTGPPQLDLAIQNVLRVASAWRLAGSRRGLLLHAAAVEVDGRAVAFLGPSGAGKTTIVALAGARRVLADDVVVLEAPREAGGDWRLHDTPLWAEPARRPAGGAARPLAALFALEKAPQPAIAELEPSRAAALIAAHAPFLEILDGAGPQGLDLAADLARCVPAARLAFAREPSFWTKVSAFLDGSTPA